MKVELPITIDLKEPIVMTNKVGETLETINEIILSRRPKAKDFKGISLSDMQFDDVIKLISRMCNVPISTAEELDAEDFMEVQQVIMNFLPTAGE